MSNIIQNLRKAFHKSKDSQTDGASATNQGSNAIPSPASIGQPIRSITPTAERKENHKPAQTGHITNNPNASVSNVSTKSSSGTGAAATANAYKNGTVYRPQQHATPSKNKSVTTLIGPSQSDAAQAHTSPQPTQPLTATGGEHKDATVVNPPAAAGTSLSPPADNAPLLTPVQEHHAEHHDDDKVETVEVRNDAATASIPVTQGANAQTQELVTPNPQQKDSDAPNKTCACGSPAMEKVDVACQTDGGDFDIDRHDVDLEKEPVAERPI